MGGSRLHDKMCVVTGAGSRGPGLGTGRAAAIRFAEEGARSLLIDRDEDAVRETERLVRSVGGTCDVAVLDATDGDAVTDAIDAFADRCGRVDVLLNNLGIHGPGNLLEVSEAELLRVLHVNVGSAVLASQAVLPHLLAAGGGSIVNLSSIAALRPRGATPYSTSKGAIIALTRAMAADHGADGVRVNCIAPGPLYTPMVAEGMTDELRRQRRDAAFLRVEGDAWDVAHAAVYLASDEARYVTGIVLTVDGGASIRGPER